MVLAESEDFAESNAHADVDERVSDQETHTQGQSTSQDQQEADEEVAQNAAESLVQHFTADGECFGQLQAQGTVFDVDGDSEAEKEWFRNPDFVKVDEEQSCACIA